MNCLSLVTPLLSSNPSADAWRAIINRLGSFCTKRVCKIGDGRRWWRCFKCKWRCLGWVTWISFLDWKTHCEDIRHSHAALIIKSKSWSRQNMNSYLISYLYRNYSWGSCMLAGSIQILTWKQSQILPPSLLRSSFCSWWQWEVLPLHPWYGLVLLLNFSWLIHGSNKRTAPCDYSEGRQIRRWAGVLAADAIFIWWIVNSWHHNFYSHSVSFSYLSKYSFFVE